MTNLCIAPILLLDKRSLSSQAPNNQILKLKKERERDPIDYFSAEIRWA